MRMECENSNSPLDTIVFKCSIFSDKVKADLFQHMLAPSSAQAPYPSPRRKRQVSSIPLRLLSKSQSRCWIAILYFLHTSAQRWFLLCHRARIRCRGKKTHAAATRGSRRRTVPAAEGCKDANRSRRYPLTLLLRQTPEPLVGAALRKNAEISLCDFQRPL